MLTSLCKPAVTHFSPDPGSLVRLSTAFPGLGTRHTAAVLTIPFIHLWRAINNVKHTIQSWSEETPSIKWSLSLTHFISVEMRLHLFSGLMSDMSSLKWCKTWQWTYLEVVLVFTGRSTVSLCAFHILSSEWRFPQAVSTLSSSLSQAQQWPLSLVSYIFVTNHSQENPGSWWLC